LKYSYPIVIDWAWLNQSGGIPIGGSEAGQEATNTRA
jgi:hypothetical protein